MAPQIRPRVCGIALRWNQRGGTMAEAHHTAQRMHQAMMRRADPKDVTSLDDYLLQSTHPVMKAAMQALEMNSKKLNTHAATGPAAWGDLMSRFLRAKGKRLDQSLADPVLEALRKSPWREALPDRERGWVPSSTSLVTGMPQRST